MRSRRSIRSVMGVVLLVTAAGACGDDTANRTTSVVTTADTSIAVESAPGLGSPALGLAATEGACLAPGSPPEGTEPATVDLFTAVGDLATTAGVIRDLAAASPVDWAGDPAASLALRRFLEDLYDTAEQAESVLTGLGATRSGDEWVFPTEPFPGATLASVWESVLVVQATTLPALYTDDLSAQAATSEICTLVDSLGLALAELVAPPAG